MTSWLICQNGHAKSRVLRLTSSGFCWKRPAEVDGSGHPHKGAVRGTRMAAVLPTVLNLFVALAGPHGSTMYVAPSQIVAIIGSPDVGACPTTLITMSQPVYVCESPAEVKRKLEAEMILNSEKSAAHAPSMPRRI